MLEASGVSKKCKNSIWEEEEEGEGNFRWQKKEEEKGGALSVCPLKFRTSPPKVGRTRTQRDVPTVKTTRAAESV